eukprot:6177715-Pleurochrysis_carterae.AAC.2
MIACSFAVVAAAMRGPRSLLVVARFRSRCCATCPLSTTLRTTTSSTPAITARATENLATRITGAVAAHLAFPCTRIVHVPQSL